MPELTSMRKLRWEKRKKEITEAAAKKAQQVSDWYHQNQEMLKVVVPAAAAGAVSLKKAVGSVARSRAVKNDIRDRQTRFYDHSLGMYWHTRRPLTSDELRTVQRRKAAGENYGDIFKSMKLLK